MSKEAMKRVLEAAYLAGFNASGEGYNSEYPFRDYGEHPEQDAGWMKDRNAALDKMAENERELGIQMQPAQQEPVAWIDMSQWPPIRWRDGMLRKDVDQFDGQGLYTSPQPAQQQEPVAWTLLLVGKDQGLVGKAGEKFVGNPEHYERVDVFKSPQPSKLLAEGQLEVSVRYNHGGSEFSASKRWNEAWCLRELDRIVANDIHTIRKQIEEAAHGIKENT